MIVQAFYNEVTQAMRSMIDVVGERILINKTEDEAYNLIVEVVLNNYQWSNARTPSKKVEGKFNIDALTLLTAKMDVMTQSLDHLNVNVVNSCAPSPPFNSCGSFDHMTLNYQVKSNFSQHSNDKVVSVNNFQPWMNRDPYCNIYNPD